MMAIDTSAVDRRQAGNHRVEQVAGPLALDGRDRDRLAEAEFVKLGARDLGPAVLDLVGGRDDRLVGPAELVGNIGIGTRRAGLGVQHEDDHVGLADRLLGLLDDLVDVAAVDLLPDAAGVDNREVAPIPIGLAIEPIAGRPGHVVGHRSSLADQAIEEGRLADVGAADDGDDRVGHGGL
jgi:hypothetical protein